MEKQNRFKSKAAWMTVAAMLLYVLKSQGLLAPLGITEDNFKEVTTLLFASLTAFGIFNDPTNKDGF